MSWNSFPGAGHHQGGGGGGGGYGPPGGYGGPPPPNQGGWSNGPPPPPFGYNQRPPPPQQYGGYNNNPPPPPNGNYPGQQYNAPPPIAGPPPNHYQQTGAGYMPPQRQQGNMPPYGPPPVRPPTGQQAYGPQMQGGHGSQRPFFQYSQCTGRRKALLIGINYFNTSSALRGCINDAHNVQKFLIERYRYKPEDIVMLTDDSRNPRQIPTRANMIQAMHWLVQGAQPDDALFFHYSGHGGQTKDLDGDEEDGYDEVVYPLDFKQAGHIVDDETCPILREVDRHRHNIMVRALPPGARLTAIFDSCHSGTALDLPYVYSTEGKIKEPNLLAEAGQGLLGAGMSYLRGDMGGMLKGVMGIGKSVMGSNSEAAERTKQTKTSPADVIMWSGCKDSQTSADTSEAGKATGAMSYAFIAALTKYPEQSYVQLLNSIRDELKGKYDQKPQLSASHPIDTNLLFIA